MNSYLSIIDLRKSFGGLEAVADLTFEVSRGQISGIIGPNGAGKTTVFNLITGFVKPDRGRIIWQGRDIAGKKSHRIVNMGLSRTFQLVKPFRDLSLFDNIRVACYGPRFMKNKTNSQQIKTKIYEVANKIGLPNDLDQLASNLGQGDLRLLDIARALITKPDLLLLDEPFSGLSSIETRRLAGVIRGLNHQGLTILIIEHKLKELMKLVDRIVAIDFGLKLAEGTPHEVVNDPHVIEAYLGRKEKHVTA
ncbi:MAG: ABC transporter ATP-binding protein [Desulfobacterales bacterium]|nr:ABC transporter ATP-binding protein [Desulfobacterales bacterium]